ncbi:MAG: hypothetical protein ACM3PP_09230 [Candidatus Saccharibacteria bacterium]
MSNWRVLLFALINILIGIIACGLIYVAAEYSAKIGKVVDSLDYFVFFILLVFLVATPLMWLATRGLTGKQIGLFIFVSVFFFVLIELFGVDFIFRLFASIAEKALGIQFWRINSEGLWQLGPLFICFQYGLGIMFAGICVLGLHQGVVDNKSKDMTQ